MYTYIKNICICMYVAVLCMCMCLYMYTYRRTLEKLIRFHALYNFCDLRDPPKPAT